MTALLKLLQYSHNRRHRSKKAYEITTSLSLLLQTTACLYQLDEVSGKDIR